MKWNELLLLILFSIVMQSCIGGCGNINTNKYSEDDNYWDSINKEKRLKEIGMDDAANIERKARQNTGREELIHLLTAVAKFTTMVQ